MESLNPMFQKKRVGQLKSVNVRKSEPKDVNRKIRSDKKFDVKVPMEVEDRVYLRKLARSSMMYPTHYSSELVRKGLYLDMEFGYYSYPSSSPVSFHVKLIKSDFERLKTLSIEWDCSLRRAAHRVLKTMMDIEGGI